MSVSRTRHVCWCFAAVQPSEPASSVSTCAQNVHCMQGREQGPADIQVRDMFRIRVTSNRRVRTERSVVATPRTSVHAMKKMLSLQPGTGA